MMMRPPPKLAPQEGEQVAANRQTASLAGLALMLALVVVCLLLVRVLHHKAVIEDCMMSGRSNCAPIEVDHP
jgi:hypothetical protein